MQDRQLNPRIRTFQLPLQGCVPQQNMLDDYVGTGASSIYQKHISPVETIGPLGVVLWLCWNRSEPHLVKAYLARRNDTP